MNVSVLSSRCRVVIFGRRGAFWVQTGARTLATEAPTRTRKPHEWKRDRPPYNQKPRFLAPRGEAFYGLPHVEPPTINPGEGIKYFETNVHNWASDEKQRKRLESFGLPSNELGPLLKAFASAVTSKSLSTPECIEKCDLHRFEEPLHHRINISVIYSTVFFAWASSSSELLLRKGIKPSTIETICKLVDATDRKHVTEDYAITRRLQRKVIMHVGPTNSGKTYHALRALAAARSGVYAGPLRLLAHEIWERLNLGQIAPLGAEDPSFEGTEVTQMLDTLAHADAIRKYGNPKHARLCNMITGEEQKMVVPDVGLLSCTVEMLNYYRVTDVSVVDEIQMICDPQRGGAWTSAVIGLPARELHLCGEETAVPVVRELLKHTGDEIVVRRYERLTPLTVEEESLNGDWSKIQKGDCVVAFSRGDIFTIKKEIEQTTGLKCAVIYGRLPPEIRSEQAALFNDPNSGYDVLVGSDAIGMGLNLKIRRVIFHSTDKIRSGGGREPLSVSTVKQIAGRAGRFGMQTGNEAPGGFATCFRPDGMDHLRQCLSTPFSPLPFARIGITDTSFQRIQNALPKDVSTATIVEAHHYISALLPKTRYHESDHALLPICDFVDQHGGKLTTVEKVKHLMAPIVWRDHHSVAIAKNFMHQASENGMVDIEKALKAMPYYAALEKVEKAKAQGHTTLRKLPLLLSDMETMHKGLVLYIWMSFRYPVLYCQAQQAGALKERLEEMLQWTLQTISAQKGEEERREWRKEECDEGNGVRAAARRYAGGWNDSAPRGVQKSGGERNPDTLQRADRPHIPSLTKLALQRLTRERREATSAASSE